MGVVNSPFKLLFLSLLTPLSQQVHVKTRAWVHIHSKWSSTLPQRKLKSAGGDFSVVFPSCCHPLTGTYTHTHSTLPFSIENVSLQVYLGILTPQCLAPSTYFFSSYLFFPVSFHCLKAHVIVPYVLPIRNRKHNYQWQRNRGVCVCMYVCAFSHNRKSESVQLLSLVS